MNKHSFRLVFVVPLLLMALPVASQVLDASWDGREQAAAFFQASLEKERQPADWSGVIHEIEKALKLSPEPSWESSIQDASGRWRRHYLPYFYLGRAHWMDGDCSLAVEILSTSLSKQEVCRSKQGEIRELQKLLVKCEQQGVVSERSPKEFIRDQCSAPRNVARIPSPGLTARVEIALTFIPAITTWSAS